MSLRKRRILYISFIVLFLTITPGLILYALGYNLDDGFKLQKSGILIIDSEPEGATISIENKKVRRFWSTILGGDNKVQTPAKLKNIKPGEYSFSVELPGYWPWTKKLKISPGQTTFAEDIYLFKNDIAHKIEDIKVQNSKFSQNKKLFVSLGTEEYSVLDLESLDIKNFKLEANSEPIKTSDISWASNNRFVLCDNYLLSTDKSSESVFLPEILGSNFTFSSWDSLNKNSIIYYSKDKLFSYDFSKKTSSEIMKIENLIAYLSKDEYVYFIEQIDNKSVLSTYNRNSGESSQIIELPLSEYRFINSQQKFLNIYDTSHQILYLIEPRSSIRPLVEIVYNGNTTKWIDDNRLLYSTGFELWLLDISTLEKKLYTRLSEKIVNLEWHPSNNYILFSTNKDINVLELDSREKYSITKILNSDHIKDMILDKKGEQLFFTTKDLLESDIYTLLIQ